jgi:hypothetical protein
LHKDLDIVRNAVGGLTVQQRIEDERLEQTQMVAPLI